MFRIFKRNNKNVICDNGQNLIYYDTEKGKGTGVLSLKFNKVNGEIHGEYKSYDLKGNLNKIKLFDNGKRIPTDEDKKAKVQIEKLFQLTSNFLQLELDCSFRKLNTFNTLNLDDNELALVSKEIKNTLKHILNLDRDTILLFLKYRRNYCVELFYSKNNIREFKRVFFDHLTSSYNRYKDLKKIHFEDTINEKKSRDSSSGFVNLSELEPDGLERINEFFCQSPKLLWNSKVFATVSTVCIDYDNFIDKLNAYRFPFMNCSHKAMTVLKDFKNEFAERQSDYLVPSEYLPRRNKQKRLSVEEIILKTKQIILENKKSKKEIVQDIDNLLSLIKEN